MGNANAREDGAALAGAGGGDEASGRRSSVESGVVEDHYALNSRVPSADLMVNSPPQSPPRSASPLLFGPQVSIFMIIFSCLLYIHRKQYMYILCVYVCVCDSKAEFGFGVELSTNEMRSNLSFMYSSFVQYVAFFHFLVIITKTILSLKVQFFKGRTGL